MLRELQLALGRAIHERGGEGPCVGAVLGRLRAVGELTPAQTLALYQSSVAAALERALREIYPVCAALVGEDCFGAISQHCAMRFPSTGPDLARVGDRLPELVDSLSFLESVPYLADVAALELAWHRAFSAPEPVEHPDLEGIAEAVAAQPDRYRFVAPPSLALISSKYPILEIWQAHRAACSDEIEIDLGAGCPPSLLAVWRRGDEVRVDRVEPTLWPLIRSIVAGEVVACQLRLLAPQRTDDVELLLQQDPDEFAPLLEAIGSLFARGWIAGIRDVPGGDHPT